jgi:SAM-dependent methyltransferase
MSFWDERYQIDEYIYGVEPNDFLRAEAHRIPLGPVLCLADGEGRNGVFLAGLGHEVTSVDLSSVGLGKAARLAKSKGVTLELVQADLATYELPVDRWSAIVEIFAHMPPVIRSRVHAQIPRALRAGGCLVYEAYRPEQLPLGTGGPKDVTMMPPLAELRGELASLELELAREVDREIHEGRFHGGPSATVQVIARRA